MRQNYVGVDADSVFLTLAGSSGSPGDYPSDGGTSNVLDIWQRFAPNLDFIAPDICPNHYGAFCEKYRHRNQPLFIPERVVMHTVRGESGKRTGPTKRWEFRRSG